MPSLLDLPDKYPSIWLAAFGLGSTMCVAAIGYGIGVTAAGYTAGFLALSGTFAFEMLTRRKREVDLFHKIHSLEDEQNRIVNELARTRSDIDTMKDDMVTASRAIVKDAGKASTTRTVIRSFERMGNRARASFMPKEPPANMPPIMAAPASAPAPSTEMRAQKYKDLLLTPVMDAPHHAHIPDEKPPEYTDAMVSELIHQAVQNDRIEIFAQPIVKLPSRRLRYIELYGRIRAKTGVYLGGQKYRAIAEKEELITSVDHLLVSHAINMIRNDSRRNIEIGYFVNISSRSLKDQGFMSDILEFVRNRRDLCKNLVLEFQFEDFQTIPPSLQRIVDGLTRLGCIISVDNVTDTTLNADNLAERGISYLKYNAGKILEQANSYEGEMAVMRLKASLDRAGIAMIIEKIEDNHTIKELLDFDVDYGEGHLFGKPDLEMAYRPKRAAS